MPGWLVKAMGGVGQPTSDLSLRFDCFWAIGRSELTFSEDSGPSDALARRLCCEIVQRPVKLDPKFRVFQGFRAQGGNL